VINLYGKTLKPLLHHKSFFFDSNDELLKSSQEINSIYVQQPERKKCKNCDAKLQGNSFTKQGVKYVICSNCGHLNGSHEDTEKFCSSVYVDKGGENYASNYSESNKQDYDKRVCDIYIPKVEFLKKSISSLEKNPESLNYVDFGAGTGYFLSALAQEGFVNSVGYEVSKSQVDLGNLMMGGDRIFLYSKEDTVRVAQSLDADVVTMVGVLEHLQNPREVLLALKENTSVQYLLLSLPMFSPCVFLEMVFPNIMQRHLSAGHTHLYTEESLDWMMSEFSLERISAWWFGVDMMDFYRMVSTSLVKNPETKEIVEYWEKMFLPLMDSMQLEVDKKHMSSEVHLLLKFS
jgi:hypothetical protein